MPPDGYPMRFRFLLAVPLLSVMLSSCAVGPRYSRPNIPAPPAFKEASAKTGRTSGSVLPGWWTLFNDPLLTGFESQVQVSNQDIAGAEARFQSARAALRSSRSSLFPTVTAAPSFTNSRQPTIRKESFNQVNLPIDASYEADVWGRVRNGVAASRASAQALAADLASVRLTLQAELAYSYFQLRGVDETARTLDQIINEFQSSVALAEDRLRVGLASREEVVQAQAQLEAARVQRVDLGVQRTQLEHAIAVLIGKAPADFTVAPTEFKPQLPAVPPGLPADLLQRRPDIAAAERRAAAANAQIGIAQAAFYPSVMLGATAGFSATDLSQVLSWPSRAWSAGPELAQTLFDKGSRRAISDEAIAQYDAAAADYRQAVLTAFQNVEDQLAATRVLADEAAAQARATRSAEEQLDLANANYQAGTVSFLNILTAQAGVLNQRVAEVDLATRRQAAVVQLIKALGGGWNTSELPTAEQLQATARRNK